MLSREATSPLSIYNSQSERIDTAGNISSNTARDCKCIQCLKDKMRENGWCPHQSDYLSRIHDHQIFSYFANRKPLEEPRQHDACIDEPFCVAYNVNIGNYQTRHVQPNCKCNAIEVPYDELLGVLRTGDTPLISIEVLDNGLLEAGQGLRLHVHRARAWLKIRHYVAISHVWAHGLGNPKANALPMCQLLALKGRLAELSPKLLFWMDTLCIPVNSTHENLKMQTIHNMASIYAMAHSVLVLDQGLMSLAGPSSHHDGDYHISTSAWMRRSWTFQEGFLAQRLFFQFHDEAYMPNWTSKRIDVLISMHKINGSHALEDETPRRRLSREDEFDNIVRKDLIRHLHRTFSIKRDPFQITKLRAVDFVPVWNALAGRSTTMSDDLYLIFANVLDIKTEPLIDLKTPEEKLKHIIFSFETLPISLLFVGQSSQSKEIKGLNAWIPSQLGRNLLTNGRSSMRWNRDRTMLYLSSGYHYEAFIANAGLLNPVGCIAEFEGSSGVSSVQCQFDGIINSVLPTSTRVCLIIERAPLGTETYRRGACFIVSETVEDTISYGTLPKVLHLNYCFPIHVKKSNEFKDTKSVSLFHAYRLDKKYELRVNTGKLVFNRAQD